MNKVVLSPAAELDLHAIWDRLARRRVGAAHRCIAGLFDAFEVLARTPAMRLTRRDLTDKPVFFWPLGEFLILYRVQSARVQVIGITQGPADIPAFVRKSRP